MFKSHLKIIALAGLAVTSSPAMAQEDLQEGLDLFGEATRMILRGIFDELGPAWEDMQLLLDNLNGYHPPEVLPNGDIIIRRKTKEDDGDALEL